MSQSTNGKNAESQPNAAAESPPSSTAAAARIPKSDFYLRATPDTGLLNLALRLSGGLSQAQMLSEVSAALAALLPDCCVEIRGHEDGPCASSPASTAAGMDSAFSASEAFQSSVRSLGRCEWHLSDDPDGPVLSVSLKQVRQSGELARVLDVGERVAVLLGAALRRETFRLRQATQADEIVELRRRIIQSDKLASYGLFVASVLHDLNSPLTAILAYSEYLTRALETSGVQPADMERLAHIREAAETVLKQARGLVEYSCPPRAPFADVDLASLVQRALCLCEHELLRAGVTVHCQLDPNLAAINGHAEHLTQLFVNLFTNAAHAARPRDARIDVETLAQQGSPWIEVRIRDNGQGIQSSDLEHVFDPFYTTRGASGCGLGLSIVRDIAEHHGGQISVESTPLVGTTFVLLLPMAKRAEERATRTPE
jgi:signal transduction histidine kinase